MYKVTYTKGGNSAFSQWFESFAEAAKFSLEQKFIIEIKYYDPETYYLQD